MIHYLMSLRLIFQALKKVLWLPWAKHAKSTLHGQKPTIDSQQFTFRFFQYGSYLQPLVRELTHMAEMNDLAADCCTNSLRSLRQTSGPWSTSSDLIKVPRRYLTELQCQLSWRRGRLRLGCGWGQGKGSMIRYRNSPFGFPLSLQYLPDVDW